MSHSIDIAFNVPQFVTIDGEKVAFPNLSVNEIATELAKIKAGRLAQARELAKEFNVGGIEGMKTIRDVMEWEPIINALWGEVAATKGAIDVLTRQLIKSGKTEEQVKVIINKIDHETLIETALAVCGYLPSEEEQAEAEKGKTKGKGKNSKKVVVEDETPGFRGQ
jgi:hypothetical protein